MLESLRAQPLVALVALFAAGSVLSNFPPLALWDREALIFGVPLFPAALFLLWVLIIAALALVMKCCDAKPERCCRAPRCSRAWPSPSCSSA